MLFCQFFQGFTYPVRAHFLENLLEITGYRLTPYNQIDDYGQEKTWKMQKQAQAFKKRKSQIASSVEVYKFMKLSDSCNMHEFVFSSSYSSFKPFDRMSLKLPTIKGIAHTLGSLYLAGIQTQLVLTSLSMCFVT